MITSLCRWLTQTVLEEQDADQPLRLRRVSALLLAGGWATFLASCLCGIALVRFGVPIRGWTALMSGQGVGHVALQWTRVATELLGAAAFFAGLFSVGLFDRRDNPSAVRAD